MGTDVKNEREGTEMKKRLVTGILAAACVAAVWILGIRAKDEEKDPVPLPVVSVETPGTRDIRRTTSLLGRVEPSQLVYVYARAAGDITGVHIQAGDQVRAGQILCEIDTRQVETAKSGLDSAALRLRQAQEDLRIYQVLFAAGDISQQMFTQYRDQAQNAQIQYDQAKFAYDTQMSYSQVTAPLTGKVELCNMEPYDAVSPGSPICVISGEGSQVVSFSVTERIRKYLREGDLIHVEKEGVFYDGTICEISTMAEDTTGLYKVKADMDSGTHLPAGIWVKLSVTVEETENGMVIPLDSVYFEEEGAWVYVCREGLLQKRKVELGICDDWWAEILDGLSMEDLVVTSWTRELYEGAPVEVEQSKETVSESETEAGV